MIVFVALSLAGGLGAVCRVLVDTEVARRRPWRVPVGTLVVNMTACFALGLVVDQVATHAGGGDLKLIVGTGFLGGYSTFSTASIEGARLIREGRIWAGVTHAVAMAATSMAAAWVGLALTS